MLNTIIKANERKVPPPKILLYGQEGIGKTLFATQAKNPIFIQTENGFGSRIPRKDAFPQITKYDQFLDYLDTLLNESHDYKTVVIDHIDMIEHIMQREEIVDSNKTSKSRVKTISGAAGGFNRGPEVINNQLLDEVLPRLDALWSDKSMMIIMLAHCSIEKVTDITGSKYKTYAPSMDAMFSMSLRNWADCVLFAKMEVGSQGEERVLYCQPSTTYYAKSRYFDDDVIPLDFEAFRQCIAKSMSNNNQQKKEEQE